MISNDRPLRNVSPSNPRSAQFILLIFLIGIFLGYGLATLRNSIGDHNEKITEDVAAKQSENAAARDSTPSVTPVSRIPRITDAIVRIETSDATDGSIHRTLGVVTAQDHTLILPLSAVKNASEGSLLNSRGHRFTLQKVIGENIEYGIVAVKSELSSGLALQISDEKGALYLGREFTALADKDETSGWVDSLSFNKPNGVTTYLVKLQRPIEWQGGAMIDDHSRALIGIAMAATSDPTVYEVIDTSAVQEIMESIPGNAALQLADYSKHYFEQTPTGMLERIQMMVNQEEWGEVIRLSGELLLHHPDYQARINSYLEKAYLTQIGRSIDSNDIDHALALMDEARQKFDESPQSLLLRAEISEKLGDLQGAREFLRQAMSTDPSVRDMVIPRIRRLVQTEINEQGQRLSTDAAIDLLRSEIVNDPDFGVYYSLLGKQYYKQGDYREAVSNLENAIRLDSSLAQELRPIITVAQQRMDTPGLIEVPLFSNGSVYYVLARLNGFPRQFRFMIDTGASFSAISNEVAKQLGILIPDNVGVLTISTANGLIQAPLRKLKSLELDGAVVKGVDVVILDTMNDFDGLIGLSYLDHFDVDINRSELKLRLVRR